MGGWTHGGLQHVLYVRTGGFAAQIWEQNHPKAVVGPLASEESSLTGDMVITLLFCVLTVTLLFVGLVWTQYQTNKLLRSKNV